MGAPRFFAAELLHTIDDTGPRHYSPPMTHAPDSAPIRQDCTRTAAKKILLASLEPFLLRVLSHMCRLYAMKRKLFLHEGEKVGCSACLPTFVDTLQATCICNGSLPSLMDPARLASGQYGSRQWGRQGPRKMMELPGFSEDHRLP